MKAIVLSGGGSLGAFQVGVLSKLDLSQVTKLYGTSTGAIQAAGVAFIGVERLEKLWREIRSIDDMMTKPFPLALPWKRGYYDLKPFYKKMEKEFAGSIAKHDFAFSLVDMQSGVLRFHQGTKGFIFQEHDARMVLASCVQPAIMENHLDKHLVDGGLRDQTPLKQAIDDGFTDITVILCHRYKGVMNPWKEKGVKIVSNGLRAISIILNESFQNDLKVCLKKNSIEGYKKINLTVYSPNVDLGDSLNFNPDVLDENMALGKLAEAVRL